MIVQWHSMLGLPFTVAGAARGFHPEFPFHPHEGNLSRKAKDAGKYLAESTGG